MDVDDRNHVDRIFVDQCKEFLALQRLLSDFVDQEMLIQSVEVEKQNKAD